jgi:hypothetical protein
MEQKTNIETQGAVPVGSGAWLGHARWKIADILSLIACKLRGQKWYIADNWSGVPGNRAAELKQSVWERCVALELTADNKDPEWLDAIDRELTELGQIAGENWGHINAKWPNALHEP